MTILGCIAHKHNIWLVGLAAIICLSGSWVTARLFQRTTSTNGLQKIGWHFLSAVAGGVAIWCTHFIAMLGFNAGVPVTFEPVMTIASLLVAVFGATAGFVIASSRITRCAPAIGGAVVGLAIAAMHYTGMIAYRVQGIVSWNRTYLAASIILSVTFSAAALYAGLRGKARDESSMASLLAVAIVSLHFTGMTAFRVAPLLVDGSFSNPQALNALAIAIAGMALTIVGAGLASYLIDDSARAECIESLRRIALHDSLTTLPNRVNFNERLDREIEHARITGGKFALIGIDLNRFKEINDLRGHKVGDEVLRALGQRLGAAIKDGEFVARVGGDEFAAIHRTAENARLSDFLARLEAVLFRPIPIEASEITPGASIGVTIWPDDATEKEILVNNADLAMYRAKSGLVKATCFYEAAMDENVRARRTLTADLREAHNNGQLHLHYQVQTAMQTGEVRGYEALLRWEHPEHGAIPPAEFIPLAEESGLILPIGEWVLRTACADASSWEQASKVAVNLSAVQFTDPNLPHLVMEALLQTGLSPDRLELELTESTIFADKNRALHVLRQIKNLGVSIALDDFGTGYSSLDTLLSFPFDRIKLDRSFIGSVESNPQARSIIRAVLALGKSLHIPVLAEGIETEAQLSLLCSEGCDEAQGFLFGRPMPLSQIVMSRRVDDQWREAV